MNQVKSSYHDMSEEKVRTVSVVIPTYNRADIILSILPSYLQFECVIEVIIVDDGSEESVRSALKANNLNDPRLRLIFHPQNMGMTFARNTGVRHSTGDLILISEDDLEPAPKSIDILAKSLCQTNADIIAGRRIWMRFGETHKDALSRANNNRHPPVNTRLMEVNSHAITAQPVEVPLVNATMLIRRHVFDFVSFADCYPGNAWREESDFQLSALEQGYRIVFCPEAIFYHHDRRQIGRGRSRIASNLRVLYWIHHNNRIFLERHFDYLRQNYPESLWFKSTLLTSIGYTAYRTFWLIKSEARRGLFYLARRD
jgi:GT2 family glycosyltransferase